MFSNGSEAITWQKNNCWKCWKYKADQEETEKNRCRCKTGFDIDLGYVTGELPERVKNIISKSECKFLIEKRPVYIKKKSIEPLPLFKGVLQ